MQVASCLCVYDKAEIVLRWNKYIEIIIVRGQEEHDNEDIEFHSIITDESVIQIYTKHV